MRKKARAWDQVAGTELRRMRKVSSSCSLSFSLPQKGVARIKSDFAC